ncbi:MAG: O-methyltransferase [Candidatus Izemoplasmatales bacterium]|nr:O-methyltransferase [Candidatus Izemoplasmatales bacterium]
MNSYLSSLNQKSKPEIIQKILSQAKELKTPIISEEGINLLIQLIQISKAKSVLEIGSAIGYSAIMMALNSQAVITTIEKDLNTYNIARANVESAFLSSRVNVIHGDALEVDLMMKFDLIFIDAAKGQYYKFLEKFKHNLVSQGIVVCDNLLFHGMVENKDDIESKRLRSLVKKISDFNKIISTHPDFDTYIYEIGDGMSISIKKGDL